MAHGVKADYQRLDTRRDGDLNISGDKYENIFFRLPLNKNGGLKNETKVLCC